MFEPDDIPLDKPGFRTCSNCQQEKPVDEFYKDGKDSQGNPKYRRDCKECYRVTRLKSRRKPKPKPNRRKK